MYNWDLDRIYNGIDSKEYKEDYSLLKKAIEEFNEYDFSVKNDFNVFKNAFKIFLVIIEKSESLSNYLGLRLSVNSNDLEALKEEGKLDTLLEESSAPEVKMNKYVIGFDELYSLVEKDPFFNEYRYYVSKMIDESKRLLSDETEVMLVKLNKSGGSAWERMFDNLTSTLEVDHNDKTITLPMVRNLAYSEDPNVRKSAYEAELKSYKKIDKTIAQALSSIKQQVTTINEARGYKSAIEKVCDQTGMTEKTLEALLGAIDDYLPKFREYFKRKGKLLGYTDGLPFYDLFAPIGKSSSKFSVEEANKYLVDRFSKFNKEISSMMETAMANNWIDYLPRSGKVGGAFCSGIFKIKEARILSNFDGAFGDVVTLAHELGHAYHHMILADKSILASNYPMQLAETASTFNETYLKDDAMKNSKDKDELLFILENSIQDDAQVVVDCISRYYFEKSVFENTKESALTPEELCELMIKAQDRTYGDGLKKEYHHPYMWCCKGHYYSCGLSYYNFPYAFGQLFAYGLYQIYLEKGDEFFDLYKDILGNAGLMPIKECALKAGINVEEKSFWVKSLDLIKDKIDKFLELTE